MSHNVQEGLKMPLQILALLRAVNLREQKLEAEGIGILTWDFFGS